jgi:hypothetical protein
LRPAFFGVILPSVGQEEARRVSERLGEGLADAAGVNDRFSFKIVGISYPEQTSTAQDLELVVSGWLSEEDAQPGELKEAYVGR